MSWIKKNIKWIGAAALALIVVWLLWLMLRPPVVSVQSATVEKGELTVSVSDDGIVRHRDVYTVAAPVAGRLLRVAPEPGDQVTAGESVVARLLPAVADPLDSRTREERRARLRATQAAVAAAEAERQRARALREDAAENLRRLERLYRERMVSQQERDSARHSSDAREAELQAAGARVHVRENERRAARALLSEAGDSDAEAGDPGEAVGVTAPVSGVLLRVLEESERQISAGTPIVEIGDPASLEVAVDFLSQDAVRMSPGDPVVIDRWGGDSELAGRVRRIEPFAFTKVSALGIEEQRSWVVIDLSSPREQWRNLAHGYRVEARVLIEQLENVPTIPVGALFRRGGRWATFAIEGGHAQLRELQIGAISDRVAEVVSGLEVGEKVVVFPSDRVKDGVAVTTGSSAEAP